jgi:hypothetical protein
MPPYIIVVEIDIANGQGFFLTKAYSRT